MIFPSSNISFLLKFCLPSLTTAKVSPQKEHNFIFKHLFKNIYICIYLGNIRNVSSCIKVWHSVGNAKQSSEEELTKRKALKLKFAKNGSMYYKININKIFTVCFHFMIPGFR